MFPRILGPSFPLVLATTLMSKEWNYIVCPVGEGVADVGVGGGVL